MPNTLTNVKDIKAAQAALQPCMAALTPLRAASTNFSPEPADKLDTVRVPVVGRRRPYGVERLRRTSTANVDSTVNVETSKRRATHAAQIKTAHVTAREAPETALISREF